MIALKYLLAVMMVVLVVGCSENNQIPTEQSAIKGFLENKGYQVISYEGQIESYELTKQKLITAPYMIYWGLQPVDPSDYLDKTIAVEKFIVKHHPLAEGKVEVYVYVVDGEPIGGTSHPHEDTSILSDGGYWSLEGNTLEELQPMSYPDWQKHWVNKYSE